MRSSGVVPTSVLVVEVGGSDHLPDHLPGPSLDPVVAVVEARVVQTASVYGQIPQAKRGVSSGLRETKRRDVSVGIGQSLRELTFTTKPRSTSTSFGILIFAAPKQRQVLAPRSVVHPT